MGGARVPVHQIIALRVQGLLVEQIAAELRINEKTVRVHLPKELRKRRPVPHAVQSERKKVTRRRRDRRKLAAKPTVWFQGSVLPRWVPVELRHDYVWMARLYGEEVAASKCRHLKAEASRPCL